MHTPRIIVFSIALLAGCGQNQTDPTQVISARSDSCNLVLTQVNLKRQSEAITGYQEAIAKNIRTLDNLEKLGWSYIQAARNEFDQGYYTMALSTSKCIEDKFKNTPQSDLLQAYALHQLHNFKQAQFIAQRLVDKRGQWFDYALLGDVLMEQGKLDGAEQAYQNMMDQKPGPQAYSRAAHLRWLTGDIEGAIELMRIAVGSLAAKNEDWAWFSTRLGYYLFSVKHFHQAQFLADQVLSIRKNYAPALYLKGQLSLAENKFAKAITQFNNAIEIHPLPEYQWALIDTLKAANKLELARHKITRLNQSAITEDPRTYALYLAQEQHNNQLAIQLASRELKVRQDVFSHDAMAWAYFANNELSLALKHLKNALAEGTPDARLYYHCALISQHANQNSQAKHCFKLAHENQHMLLPSEKNRLQQALKKFDSQNKTSKTTKRV